MFASLVTGTVGWTDPGSCGEPSRPIVPMNRNSPGGYVRDADAAVERGCEYCDWYAVEDSYPSLVKRYQDHLRSEHPRAWLRR